MSFLRSLIHQNRFYPAKKLWKSLRNPSISETRDILSLYVRNGLLPQSNEIYAQILQNNPVMAKYLFTYAIHFNSKNENWPEVWKLEDQFLADPNSFDDPDQCINSLIKVYRTTGRLDKLAALFQFMETRGFNLSQSSWLAYL
jgi:pentatricopeptide repeat protein